MSLDNANGSPQIGEDEITETIDESLEIPAKKKKLLTNAEKLQAFGLISTLSSSAEERVERASFVHYRELIEENDYVIIHIKSNALKRIKVNRGKTLNMQMGALRHDFLIGKPYGSKISTTAGYIHVLRPNPVLWTKSLKRNTQILYQHDIATIIMLLDICPGSVVCESGSGSGSLTHALAVAVGRHGHVYTHDVVETRVKEIEQHLNEHGLGERTTCVQMDVYDEGFFVTNSCDGVFLDVPEPWKAVQHAKNAFSRARGGRFVTFSPCIEQVVKTIEEMKIHGFQMIETIEVVPTNFSKLGRKQKFFNQPTVDDGPGKKRTLGKSASAPESETPVEEISSKDGPVQDDILHGAESNKKPKTTQKFESKQYFAARPARQATHSGYLTSATLLPSYDS